MSFIYFTSQDIARTRILHEVPASAETALAWELLANPAMGGRQFAPWRRQVRQRLGIPKLTRLTQRRLPLRDAYRMVRRVFSAYSVDTASDLRDPLLARCESKEEVFLAIRDFAMVALPPYRRRIADRLRFDLENRARIVLAGGVEQLFTTLHPQIRWNAPVLDVQCGQSGDVYLNGRGLRLAPSLFLHDRPGILIHSDCSSESPILLYPALADPDTVEALWMSYDPGPRALDALVGRTRAAALRALRSNCTTSELSQRLGVSAASASQHASILREAGLITTRRQRNAVVHSLTVRGVALLDIDGVPDIYRVRGRHRPARVGTAKRPMPNGDAAQPPDGSALGRRDAKEGF